MLNSFVLLRKNPLSRYENLDSCCPEAITRNWLKSNVPTVGEWAIILGRVQIIENPTCKLRLKLSILEKDWREWRCIVSKQ